MNLFIIYIVIDDGLLVAKLLTKKQYNEYMQMCQQRDEGKILTPDGLHFIGRVNLSLRRAELDNEGSFLSNVEFHLIFEIVHKALE